MSRPAGFEPYFGALSPEDTAKGTELAISNAQRLLGAAQVLFGASFFAQSTALALLAIEEVEKVFILLDILLTDIEEERRQLWLQYRRHSSKQARFTKFLQIKSHAQENWVTDAQALESLSKDRHYGENFIELKKQLFLYTDKFVNQEWNMPSRRATREGASKAIASATFRMAHAPRFTASELEIWRKYMVGFDRKKKEDKRSILLACVNELERNGLQRPYWFELVRSSL